MIHGRIAAGAAMLREKARRCRRTALDMDSALARAAMMRLATRLDIMANAEAEGMADALKSANEA
jgi:hypothetical protein